MPEAQKSLKRKARKPLLSFEPNGYLYDYGLPARAPPRANEAFGFRNIPVWHDENEENEDPQLRRSLSQDLGAMSIRD